MHSSDSGGGNGDHAGLAAVIQTGSALVMVSGLASRATEAGLRSHFAHCGSIQAVSIAVDKHTGEHKGRHVARDGVPRTPLLINWVRCPHHLR